LDGANGKGYAKGHREAVGMGRRDLLTDDERRLVFGLPIDRDSLARFYTFGPTLR